MFRTYFILLAIFLCLPNILQAQLKGGPMQSYASENSVSFWFMIEKNDTISLELRDFEKDEIIKSRDLFPKQENCFKKDCAVTTFFRKLKPNTKYALDIYVNSEFADRYKFTTNSKVTTSKDFSILTGSCGFIPFSWGKLLFPFHNLKIYETMETVQASFMLWLGDTVYYLNDDDRERKVRRNIKYRKKQKLDNFLQSKPQVAMWDDHDFGPNNADGSYIDKKGSLEVFNQFWVNPKSQMRDGSYFKISHEDVDFFVLDNRSYSNKPESVNPTVLGEKQKSWLKRTLKKSKATFKIICSGNQFLASYKSDKTFALYPKEQNEIFNFLKKNKIEGVIFLTGDRHHTEMLQKEIEGMYKLYEFSSSPLTSWANRRFNSKRFNKDERIAGTLVNKRNFGKMTFIGATGNRRCVIETIDKKGKVKFTFIINENELKF